MADESPFDAFESGGLGSAPPSSLSDDPFASTDPVNNDVEEEEEEEEEDEEVEINGKSSPPNNTIIPSSSNNNNTDSDDPFAAVDSSSSSSGSSFPSLGAVGSNESKFSEDDSAYAAWEKERTKILSDRQEKAEEKKKELLYQAKDEITKFYSDLDHRIEKTKKQNRIDEKNYKTELGALMAHGTRWEKVAKFSNLTARQTDKAGSVSRVDRMRKLLITLKTQRDQNEQKS